MQKKQITTRLLSQRILLNNLTEMCIDIPHLTQAIYDYFKQEKQWQQALKIRIKAHQNDRQAESRGLKSSKKMVEVAAKGIFADELTRKIRGNIKDNSRPDKTKPYYSQLLQLLNNIFRDRTKTKFKYISAILRLFQIYPESVFCKDCAHFKWNKCRASSVFKCPKKKAPASTPNS